MTYTGLETLTVTGFKEGVNINNLVIPAYIGGKRVAGISDRAFNGYTQLAAVTVPATVTQMGQNAFGSCNGLASITLPFVGASASGDVAAYFGYIFGAAKAEDNSYYIPSSLKRVTLTGNVGVPDSAFLGCTWLESVTLGARVPAIGANAFEGCTGLSFLSLAANGALATIGDSAFNGCKGLTSLTIPTNVTSIGAAAFEGLINLTQINFNAKAINALSVDTFSGAGSNGNGITVTFGANVTKLPTYLFAHEGAEGKTSPNIKTVTFAKGSVCTSISAWAFLNCTSLQSVTLPPSLKIIYTYAFYNTSLTSLEIPAGVTDIKTWAFANSTLLKNVTFAGTALKNIGNDAFSGCAMLNGVTLPDSVTTIGSRMFQNCTSLSSITVPAGVTTLPTSIFYGCTSLKTATLEGVTSIGNNAFENCSLLETVNLPEGLLTIGQYAFNTCSALKSVSLPSTLTGIYSYAFSATGLIAITLPQGLTSIGSYAFAETGLTSVTVPKSVTSLGSSAFSDCTALQSAILEEGIALHYNKLNSNMFNGCSRLSSVSLPGGLTAIGANAFLNCTSLTEIAIPADVTSFGESAFSGAGLTRVDYAGTLADWCGMTFTNAAANPVSITGNLYIGGTNTITATFAIPEAVTSIGAYAFYGCTGITELNLPGGLTEVGTDAFMGCTGITKAIVPTAAIGQFTNANLEYLEINGGAEIPASAFANFTGLISAKIGDTVTTIGSKAFSGCTALESITVPFIGNTKDGSANTAFKYIFGSVPASLKNIVITGGTTIAENAFSGCSNVISITIPETVTTIASNSRNMFYDCSNLAEINYNAIAVADFNHLEGPFVSATGSEEGVTVNIGAKVTVIPQYMFQGFDNLKTVNFASDSQCSKIGTGAFANTGLQSIQIPKSVEIIESGAFSYCYELKSVTFEENSKLKRLEGDVFGTTSLLTFTIPENVTYVHGYLFGEGALPEKVIFANPEGWHIQDSDTILDLSDPVDNLKYFDDNDFKILERTAIEE
ncbi:MAG: leucine-rich repeat domain-containing protein [Clostridia bacterium]|nr:leucine-rich repeat domain-containing protein [Clostridia bacterium]